MSRQLGTAHSEEAWAAEAGGAPDGAALLRRELDDARARISGLEARLATETRSRAELVNLVSHELRTPITVISGFSRLLQNEVQGPLNEEQHRFVAESLRACRRLDQFVGDLLEAGPDSPSPFSVALSEGDLHETIEAQLESLAPLLEERGLEVEAGLCCGDPVLAFDARRIEQVITNLMTNAIRYARAPGVIRLSTRSVDVDDRGDERPQRFVEVSVEDDGPGIPESDRERIFAPYVRGTSSGTDGDRKGSLDASGLGIGLAICRRIIDAHGGRIRVEASVLGGARFVFELPRAAAARGRG